MIISHRCHFLIFFDTPDPENWLHQALAPWSDEPVVDAGSATRRAPFFHGMTPVEARLAFDRKGLDFDDYTRIAVVRNPFRRMTALYDMMRVNDLVWRLKSRAGWQAPDFRSWLMTGDYACSGPFARLAPRWRRLGATPTAAWAGGQINSFVRAEFAARDLGTAFRQLTIPPVINLEARQKPHRFAELLRYDQETLAIMRARFSADLRLYSGLGSGLDLVA